jgi:uncharacterized membrane protein YfhO
MIPAWLYYGSPLVWLIFAGLALMMADAFYPVTPEPISTPAQRQRRPELAMITTVILVVAGRLSFGVVVRGRSRRTRRASSATTSRSIISHW